MMILKSKTKPAVSISWNHRELEGYELAEELTEALAFLGKRHIVASWREEATSTDRIILHSANLGKSEISELFDELS